MSDHSVPMKSYVAVFLALMVLTVITVAVAFVDLGPANILVAVLIALLKAFLVITIFMHVKYSSPLVKVYAVTGFIFLIIMFSFTFADFLSRDWLPIPQGWSRW